jgi:hypothetical protein
LHRPGQRLVDHAVPDRQLGELADLVGGGLGVQVEAKADRSEANWRVLADRERAAEVQIPLGVHGAARYRDS